MSRWARTIFSEPDLFHNMKIGLLDYIDGLKKLIIFAVFVALPAAGLSTDVSADGGQAGRTVGSIKVIAQSPQYSSKPVVEELTSERKVENLEVERKFLINMDDIPQKFFKQAELIEVIQIYISHEPEIRVRQLNQDGDIWYTFTMKLPRDNRGLARDEMEFNISRDVFQKLLPRRLGTTIHKTRLQMEQNGHYVCLDIYQNKELVGLIVAEVEFDSVRDADVFEPPAWFGKDITSDKRYKNAGLARYGKPK